MLILLAVFGAGLVAGFLNVMAGGGSLLTLPLLIFMGLPVPCGTTAHGTAFDIAGKGIAESGSLSDALTYTILLASHSL